MLFRAITFVSLFLTPPTADAFFSNAGDGGARDDANANAVSATSEATREATPEPTRDVVDSDDDDNAARFASMKRVPIRGVIDRDVVERAKTLLTLPMGAERVIVVNDKPYAFRLELHYHPPGYPNAPNGYHKGVTVYELVEEPLAAADDGN